MTSPADQTPTYDQLVAEQGDPFAGLPGYGDAEQRPVTDWTAVTDESDMAIRGTFATEASR